MNKCSRTRVKKCRVVWPVTGITARTRKLINHTRTKPARDRFFYAKDVAYLKGRKKLV